MIPMFTFPRLALLSSLLSVGIAADWPTQRGPAVDGVIPAGSVLPTALPDAPKVVWKGPAGDGFAAPIVVGGKVVYLDLQNGQETVHAITLDKAKPLWDAPLDSAHKDGFGTGPRCAPVSDGKLVFAQSCKGQLSCFDLASGKVVWSTNYVKDFKAIYTGEKGDSKGGSRHGYNGSPTLDGDHLYALVSGPGAGVVCFEKTTGKAVWKSQDDQAAYAPPIIATIAGVKQVVAFTVSGALGLDAKDGALLWRVPLTTNYGRHVMAPIVHDDLVVVGSHEVGLVATRLSAKGGKVDAAAAWTRKDLGPNFASPVRVGGHLYGLVKKQTVCVDLATGKDLWQHDGNVSTSPDKAFAAFIAAGTKVMMFNDGGELILFAADPKEYRELGRVQVCGKSWCHPAYVDGKIVVRDAKQFLCVEIVGKK
jgi:outer membrane protein assembly factor BamB